MSARTRMAGAIALGLLLASLPLAARAGGPCTAASTPGGDWPSYGHDLANTRSQPYEVTIDATNALSLEPAFAFRAPGELGTINTTPIVAGGCVFVTSATDESNAAITAIDARSGAVVWSVAVPVGAGAYGGSAVGAPVVHGDLVIAPINRRGSAGGPFAIALHRSTGAVVWTSPGVDTQSASGTNASLVVHDGMVFFGFFGNAGPWTAERGGFALLDAATGALLKKTYTIPDADFDANAGQDTYSGAGIWGTPAIDVKTGFAYVGTSNPHNPQKIHERTTSLLKIDLRRGSPTFGQIVDFYQGFRDTMVPGAEQNPACAAKPDVYYTPGIGDFSATCLAIDVDFGASPNLIRLGKRTLLGGQQKSGTYHVVDTAAMDGVSMTQVGVACVACSAASTAYAAGKAFVPAGPPGQLFGIDVALGAATSVSPIGGGFTFNPASVANGLVWMTDSGGFLDAFQVTTGAPVAKFRLQDATGDSMFNATSAAGVSIANNTIYAALGSWVVAYRLPQGAA